MRSEFVGVWSELWREVWLPLIDEPLREGEDNVPEDIFCEPYREVARALKDQLSIEALADVIDEPIQSREAFEKTTAADLAGEGAVVTFLEAAHSALDDLGGDELSNRYFSLLSGFIDNSLTSPRGKGVDGRSGIGPMMLSAPGESRGSADP